MLRHLVREPIGGSIYKYSILYRFKFKQSIMVFKSLKKMKCHILTYNMTIISYFKLFSILFGCDVFTLQNPMRVYYTSLYRTVTFLSPYYHMIFVLVSQKETPWRDVSLTIVLRHIKNEQNLI